MSFAVDRGTAPVYKIRKPIEEPRRARSSWSISSKDVIAEAHQPSDTVDFSSHVNCQFCHSDAIKPLLQRPTNRVRKRLGLT